MHRKKNKQCEIKKNNDKSICNARRSSLQVNLSYTFDLSNSENTDNSNCTVNKNTNDLSINNDINCVLANINDKDDELTKNCSRLRNAILNKTRELFDKQNAVCQMTTKILENETNQSNNEFKLTHNSPILRSSRNCNIIKLSPRKTRAATTRERLNSFTSNNSQIINESINDISTIGNPIVSSTLTNHHCNIHESCNVKKIIHDRINKDLLNTPKQLISKLDVGNDENKSSTVKKKKPSIKNIQTCNIALDGISGFKPINQSKTLQQIPMELTNIERNCILNNSFVDSNNAKEITKAKVIWPFNSVSNSNASSSKENFSNVIENEASSECPKLNCSMRVNTSLDKNCNDKEIINETDKVLCKKINSKLNDETVNENNLDDLSLMQRLRNISCKINQKECVTPIKHKNYMSPGVVDCTPTAITRSMALRTQAKLNSLDDKTKLQCSNVSELTIHQSKLKPVSNTVELEKTFILNNTPFRIENHDTDAPIIIQESSDDESIDINESNNDKKISETKLIVGKKKLFTQHDSSGPASFSPITNEARSPRVIKIKRLKKRRIMRNFAGRIIRPQSIIGKTQCHSTTQILQTSSSASSQDIDKIRDYEKKRKKKRCVKSKKIILKKQSKPNLLNLINENQDRSLDDNFQSSRSSNIFMTKKQISIKRNYSKQKIIIVSTGLCNGDKDIVRDAIKKLNGATMELSVTRKTTHVVTTGVRTINLLRGIIRGCWLVKFDWIKESIKFGKWLPADKYQIDHFSKAVEENRRDREIFGNSYVPDLFATCGLIHIQNNTTPPKDILKELIKIAGGLIIEEPKKSKIIIGTDGIKENWILDSITTGELQSIESYKRNK